ncbi:MAG: hypothetical protein IJS69_00100 [Selenomonadaceae bacterium]|nr:hypothetical protein [Selenomonadaceae bacterium]
MMLKKFLPLMIFACMLCFGGSVDAKKFPPPNLTAEFEQMDFPQLYPTYSWEPLAKTEFYQVQVVLADRNRIVRNLFNDEGFDRMTDREPFTEAGEYFWRVRVVDKSKRPLSDWSEKKFFTVTAPVTFAVLGDSISHGGAAYIPAGQLSCQWETYCSVPIKNLARSGDTTQDLLDRFDRDVLPFKPKVLLIMAGINDIRTGLTSDAVIKNLSALREKCLSNEITPVFCTITSMNPELIHRRGIDLTDGDWREAREQVNLWIMQTPYFIDTSTALTDDKGYLRAELTPDGLHPALRGKKFIGETISDYLRKTFANFL